MKVLQINSVCGVGSTGRVATDIHGLLVDRGHDSFIAYGRNGMKNCDTAMRVGTRWDNYVHVGLTRLFDNHGFGSAKATKGFIKQIGVLNPDVIQLHNIHGYYINVEVIFEYLRSLNKPVVWTLHDCWAFTGHCSHFDYIGCDRWKEQCFDCPQKTRYPTSILLDNSKRNFNRKKEAFVGINNLIIVTPSEWLAGLVKQSFLGVYPIKVINNGIDLSVFTPTPSNFRHEYSLEDKFIILGVANTWTEKKGLLHFFELAKQLSASEVIVLVGITEKQKAYLPAGIIGIAQTDSVKKLAEIYSAADVFVNPTLEDTFPTTNLEAMACGTPVITFATGGSVESVTEKTGYVVDRDDLQGLANAIRFIQRKGQDSYSRACLERTATLYNKLDRFEEYLVLYETLSDVVSQ